MKKGLLVFLITLALGLVAYMPASSDNRQEAKKYYNKAVKLKGALSDPVLLFKKEQLYKKAIELWPEFHEAHNNLGDVYERQGRFKEAIAEYRKAIEIDSKGAYPYFGLGDVYYKMGRYKEAISWYEKGLKYDPNDQVTLERLKLVKDIVEGKVMKAETIEGILGSSTRGVGEKVSITFGEGLIPFDFDRADIRPDARPQLDEIGKALKNLIEGKTRGIAKVEECKLFFEIAGHADSRGTDAYNLQLSLRRAQAVVDYLVKNFHIPKDRLIPQGYGERQPFCTEETEACYALNRRVEIIRHIQSTGKRGVSPQTLTLPEKKLAVEVGFFYQKGPDKPVYSFTEGVSLRSRTDRYFIFFRPLQDCYCYLLQEDGRGHVNLLFPEEGKDGSVEKGKDYWVPSFGKAFTLDETKGTERLYLVVSAHSVKTELEGLGLKEEVQRAVRAFKTRAIKVVKVAESEVPVPQSALSSAQGSSQALNKFLERIEGEGAWVKVVSFEHE